MKKALASFVPLNLESTLQSYLPREAPQEKNPAFGTWVSAAVRVLELSEIRDDAFK